MTWGSNASYYRILCPYCGKEQVDDTDSGPTSHEAQCLHRSRFGDKIFMTCFLAFVIGIPLAIMWSAAHFDPRVPPCLKSHTETEGAFPLFAIPEVTHTVCDQWTVK